MSYKLDFRDIVKKHIRTIVNDNTNRPDCRDYFFFLVIPIIIPIILCYFKAFIKEDFISAIISGLAILIGLALNLIVILFEIARKEENSSLNDDLIIDLIANISFIVIISIITITISLFTLLNNKYALYIFNYLTYFLIEELILAIIVLIKNMYHELVYIIKKKHQ